MDLVRYIGEVLHRLRNPIDLYYELGYSQEIISGIFMMPEERYLGAETSYAEMIGDNLGELMDHMDSNQTVVMDFKDDGQRESGWYPLIEDIAIDLCEIGYLYHGQMINWENMSLVMHKYASTQDNKYTIGLFLTSKDVVTLDGLPGSSREKSGDRPYLGIAMRRDGRVRYCVSLGNRMANPYKKDISELTENESDLVNNLLCYTYLMGGIDL